MLEKGSSIVGRITISSSFLLPRQVLLNMKSKDNHTSSSNPEMDKKKIVLHSIYQFLQRNELSKVAKKLLSQAKLDQNEALNGYEIDLEEVCFKHLEMLQLDKISKTTKDKKGKKSKSVVNNVGNGQSEAFPEEKYKDIASGGIGNEQPKEKKKKKSKSATDSQVTEAKEDTNEIAPEGKGTKSKDKKKKSNNISQNGNMEEVEKEKLIAKSTQDDNLNAEEEVMNKEKKESKKRKRLASGENDHPVGNILDTDKTKENDQISKENGSLGSDEPTQKKSKKGQNGEACSSNVLEKPSKQLDDEEKGNNEDKSSALKNMKKQRHGSAEPTTVKAFQRVKVDDVVFTDERLQDNSYWAKDGAENGYGAKAQEILGQVRGKDFRHEKTKKKRGSYRGGQIDLQSHSVKFNYSDDE